MVGGNVQTSQRIVDVLLKAFSACAASQVMLQCFLHGIVLFGMIIKFFT